MILSDKELLALAGISGRAECSQRERQAELIAALVFEESQPSCSLVQQKRWNRRRQWSRAEEPKRQRIIRGLNRGAA